MSIVTACAADHLPGGLTFWLVAMVVLTLPGAALAHLHGEHVQRRRERQARRHPHAVTIQAPSHVTVTRPATASDVRLNLAATLEQDGAYRLHDQDAER